jgi:NAD(P)H dehydrogenase (quinone)
MKVSVILAHPDTDSLNHAIARAAVGALKENGHLVSFHDLYLEGFDPIIPKEEISRDGTMDVAIAIHCLEIANAEGIIIVHPNWWGQPPAVLKGWIDRVLRAGVAYEFLEGDSGEGVPRGLLKARKALVFNTGNTKPEREARVFKDPLESIWRYCIFGLCGIDDFYRKTYSVVCTSTLEERESWLRDVKSIVGKRFPRSDGA